MSRKTVVESDWLMEVRKGNIPGHISGTWLAHCDGVSTTAHTIQDVTTTPEAYNFPAAATTMTVSSTSANDTAAGTGARYVLIDYLNSDYTAKQATVILNGQTAVTMSEDVLRVNNMRVVYSGSGEKNAGIIYIGSGTVTAGVPTNKYGLIAAGVCIMRSGHFTVPANNQLLVATISILTYTASKLLTTTLEITPYQTSSRLITSEFHTTQAPFYISTLASRPIPSKSDVRIGARVDSGTGDVSVSLGYLLIRSSEIDTRYP